MNSIRAAQLIVLIVGIALWCMTGGSLSEILLTLAWVLIVAVVIAGFVGGVAKILGKTFGLK